MKHATSRRLLALSGAVAAALAVASCGDRPNRPAGNTTTSGTAPTATSSAANSAAPTTGTTAGTSATSSSTTTASPVSTLANSDREFVTLAASSDMLEVESGRLALEKSKSSNVRSFAQHMIDDHSKTSEMLKQVAGATGATPPTTMAPPHQAHLEKLRGLTGAEFDREYAALIGVAAHQEAVALFERASREAANADIRGFAEKTLPDLRTHLQHGQTVANSVGVPADRMKVANAPPDLSRLSAVVSASEAAKSGATTSPASK